MTDSNENPDFFLDREKCFSLILNKIIPVWKAVWLFVLNTVLSSAYSNCPRL